MIPFSLTSYFNSFIFNCSYSLKVALWNIFLSNLLSSLILWMYFSNFTLLLNLNIKILVN